MTRFNYLLVFIVLLFLKTDTLISQYNILNPGVKIGYTFGQNGGFIWGFELSLISYDKSSGVSNGAVLDVDFWNNRTKIHLGAQISNLVGLCVGPTLIVENGKTNVGYSIIPFVGVLVYPYYNFTKVGDSAYSEVGTYIKYPIAMSGKL